MNEKIRYYYRTQPKKMKEKEKMKTHARIIIMSFNFKNLMSHTPAIKRRCISPLLFLLNVYCKFPSIFFVSSLDICNCNIVYHSHVHHSMAIKPNLQMGTFVAVSSTAHEYHKNEVYSRTGTIYGFILPHAYLMRKKKVTTNAIGS